VPGAKLSRESYERFGDKIAAELVNWFNQVDATYHADLEELNALNFARFDAKLEQRKAKLEERLAELRADIECRLGDQTRWLLGAWGILLAAVIGLWFR
jgi:hypothetical protein